MSDKQKQIEEIYRLIDNNCALINNCIECQFGKQDNFDCDKLCVATALYNAGYRKIPESAVVLTREEYENLGLFVETVQEYESQNGQPVLVKEKKVVKKSQTDFVDLLNREIRELQISQQARKETAEKIYSLFDEEIKQIKMVLIGSEKLKTFNNDFEKTVSNSLYKQSMTVLESCQSLLKSIIAKQFGVEIKEQV